MSVADNVKAASQLRLASVTLQKEASDLLSKQVNTARQRSGDITPIPLQLKAKQLEAGDRSKDDSERQRLARK